LDTPIFIDMELSRRLRLAVEKAGESQAEVARRSGISPQNFQRLLNGMVKHSKHLPAIAGVLKVDVRWLTTGSSPVPTWAIQPLLIDIHNIGRVRVWPHVNSYAGHRGEQDGFNLYRISSWYMDDRSHPEWRCDLESNIYTRPSFYSEDELQKWSSGMIVAQKEAGAIKPRAPQRIPIDATSEAFVTSSAEWVFTKCDGMKKDPSINGMRAWRSIIGCREIPIISSRTHVDQDQSRELAILAAKELIENSNGWISYLNARKKQEIELISLLESQLPKNEHDSLSVVNLKLLWEHNRELRAGFGGMWVSLLFCAVNNPDEFKAVLDTFI